MIPVGQPYQPSGALDLRGTLVALILGATAAALCAGLVWLWEISPIPTLLFVTPLIQGLVVGGVLAYIVDRMKLRSGWLAFLLGLGCGTLSIFLMHYGHYLRMVQQVRAEAEAEIGRLKLPAPLRQEFLADWKAHPAAMADRVFFAPATGHRGFVGSLVIRNQLGATIKHTTVSGGALWFVWGAEVLAVAFTAAAVARKRAARPFCEECDAWCQPVPGTVVLPGSQADALVTAVRLDDVAAARQLRAHPADPHEESAVTASLQACPGCGLAFADLVLHTRKGKGIKRTTKGSLLRLSPAMAEALAPTSPAGAEAPPDAGGEPEAPGPVPTSESGADVEDPPAAWSAHGGDEDPSV